MLTPAERETVIRFDEEDRVAELYTASRRVADKLIKGGLVPLKTTEGGGETAGWYFEIDSYDVIVKPSRNAIRLGVKPYHESNLSPEEKAAIRKRFTAS
ncbi:Hypothetical protein DEACI_3129 [Acididesulfobacillus acetoxydans]|uniref:Uncharacterized protein n=1 Tax=Acididesulfobacillus acetoxydans TaxID=1561005 RepID=A0A8S0Y3V4_9FIRM|nr:hypothetical protein [Acididesulfobacillus acetoxydans]CAA7602455.1 Hypothetical protein DEACI_3129 [Acididesulfobacillus acetoxydans]CEJ05910.1 Hypothetical protein DEACI_0330 [Acididesulfobacillus acetoxydans]